MAMNTAKIQIQINGFVWWFEKNHIFESENNTIGLYLYSKHITKNKLKQILEQVKQI